MELLMSLRWSPATPPEIPPLFMYRLSIAQLCNFSDSSSSCFPKEPRNVTVYETYSIHLRKLTNRAVLGAQITLAAALQRILVILAVATVHF